MKLREGEQMMGRTKFLMRSKGSEQGVGINLRKEEKQLHKRERKDCKVEISLWSVEISLWSETGAMGSYTAWGDLCKVGKESRAAFQLIMP